MKLNLQGGREAWLAGDIQGRRYERLSMGGFSAFSPGINEKTHNHGRLQDETQRDRIGSGTRAKSATIALVAFELHSLFDVFV